LVSKALLHQNKSFILYNGFNNTQFGNINKLININKIKYNYIDKNSYINLKNSQYDGLYLINKTYNNSIETNMLKKIDNLWKIYEHVNIGTQQTSNIITNINIIPPLKYDIQSDLLTLTLKPVNHYFKPNLKYIDNFHLDTTGPIVVLEPLNDLSKGSTSNITPVQFKIKFINSLTEKKLNEVKDFSINDIKLTNNFDLENLYKIININDEYLFEFNSDHKLLLNNYLSVKLNNQHILPNNSLYNNDKLIKIIDIKYYLIDNNSNKLKIKDNFEKKPKVGGNPA
jgi:hypothetical protein